MRPAVLVVVIAAAAAALASDRIVFGDSAGDLGLRVGQQQSSSTRKPTTRRTTADGSIVFMPDQIDKKSTTPPYQHWQTTPTKKPDVKKTTPNPNFYGVSSKVTSTTTELVPTTDSTEELVHRVMANAPDRDCPPGFVKQRTSKMCRRIIS